MTLADDILLDRLVDGELTPAELRELLASLDESPDGWRRCALAFLEAQSWQRELPQLVAEATSSPRSELANRPPQKRGWSINWYTLAASLLIAFGLGLALRDLPHRHQTGATIPASVAAVAPQSPAKSQLASTGRPTPGETMTVWVRDDGGNPRQLKVPLVDATALDQHLGLEFQSGLPADVRKELQQRGYEVQSKRSYAPFVLDNGRPLVVPVEDTKIVPVSNRVY